MFLGWRVLGEHLRFTDQFSTTLIGFVNIKLSDSIKVGDRLMIVAFYFELKIFSVLKIDDHHFKKSTPECGLI